MALLLPAGAVAAVERREQLLQDVAAVVDAVLDGFGRVHGRVRGGHGGAGLVYGRYFGPEEVRDGIQPKFRLEAVAGPLELVAEAGVEVGADGELRVRRRS